MREDETRHYTGRSRFDPSAVADSPADAAQRLIAALARARDGATTPEQTGARLEGEFLGLLRASQPDLKHLRGITDLTRAGAHALLTYAGLLKQSLPVRLSVHDRLLRGQTLAMIFEKPSLRTRVTFEVGMAQLGGRAIYLQPSDIQLRKRESVPDVARNLGRWVDGIMARTFVHQTILDLAEHAGVPVINGLSDLEHPCQALADFLTIQERLGEITGKKVVFVGDGNNVAHSLLLLGGLLGAHMVVACPEGYEPRAEILEATQAYAAASGGSAEVMHDPTTAVQGAHAVYTDVWASMGQEAEAEQRAQVFAPFQVNAELLAAALPEAIVMHCLPAHRGQEITDAVLDGLQSVVLDQAENRLHAQKAVLVMLMSQK
ncbi:MAG: ornithine carbamoyltransferase [Armatimonadetes bacterium]|nr:ornithine carbamoyltransferase [Armatimonadota bacterium]